MVSYLSRVYRQRNAHTHDDMKQQSFFSKQSDINKSAQKNAFFQAKLTVNKPGDQYEQEADAVANTVVNKQANAAPILQQKKISSIQRIATDSEKEKLKGIQKMDDPLKEEDEKKTVQVQTKQEGNTTTASSQVSSQIESSARKGNPMPAKTSQEMSASFGVDFSDVHIHNDNEAAGMNKELQAQAFTHGSDIYFNEGKYNPENSEGKFLLAHELTHVVQQRHDSIARQPASPGASVSPQTIIANANTRRIGTLLFVLSELSEVISAVQMGLEPNPFTFTVQAIENWLFVRPGDSAFLPTIQAAQDLFLNNLRLTPQILHQPNNVQIDPFGNACPPNFAYSRGGVEPIFFCDNFLAKGINCQRDVMIHEHFHLLNLIDLTQVATTAQALANPDSLSQLAAEIVAGPHSPSCLGTD